ncbi:hypothetical protein [Pseudothauera nasutitermitis]|uniref:hypothetical protein n=1 Tax=Pseudothauera nasutitermitis TaxID=2565930 RepID=UPI001B3B21C8|nr:hypothetical protein [Pseudothauera nasutitermitis]
MSAGPSPAAPQGGGGSPANPLLVLLDLGRRARTAASAEELAFLLVNDTRRLLPYRQAALWFQGEGIRTLSGVMQVEANAPYAQWLRQACAHLAQADEVDERPAARRIGAADLSGADATGELAAAWGNGCPRGQPGCPWPAVRNTPGAVPAACCWPARTVSATANWPC